MPRVFFTTIICVLFSITVLASEKKECTILMKDSHHKSYPGQIIAESIGWVKGQYDLREKIEMGLSQMQRKKILKILSILHIKFPDLDSQKLLVEYNKLFRTCL